MITNDTPWMNREWIKAEEWNSKIVFSFEKKYSNCVSDEYFEEECGWATTTTTSLSFFRSTKQPYKPKIFFCCFFLFCLCLLEEVC